MEIYSICSSSKGNATFVRNDDECFLIDIGCSYKRLKEALISIDEDVKHIKAILITHEHSDHIKGLLMTSKNLNIPVFAYENTLDYLISYNKIYDENNLYNIERINDFNFKTKINFFKTSHDSLSSIAYTLENEKVKIGICTDLGTVTKTVKKNLFGSKFVLIESNYDLDLLEYNPKYPYYLKRRIKSKKGHLSNDDSAIFIKELIDKGTKHILLGHLSPNNNTPVIAYNNVVSYLENNNYILNKDYKLDVSYIDGSHKKIII